MSNEALRPLLGEHAYLLDVMRMDEPSDQLKSALDTHLMALAYFGGGAWTQEILAQCFAFGWMGGFPECCVLSGMRFPICVASYTYAIRGGCVPRIDLLKKHVAPRLRDLFNLGTDAPWLPALMARYDITGWERLNFREWSPDIFDMPWVRVPVTARSRTNPLLPIINARARVRA